MSKEQCKELVRQIFGDEAANNDDIVQWYFDVNQVAMDDHAKSEMEAFDRWKSENGWYLSYTENGYMYRKTEISKTRGVKETKITFSDLYELFKKSKQ